MSNVPESEKGGEWDQVERALRAAGLWDKPISALFRALQKHVALDRRPTSDGQPAKVAPQARPQLLRLAAAIPGPRRTLMISQLELSPVRGLVADLHNQLLLESTIAQTRRLFGLTEVPGAAFWAAAQDAVAALLAWRSRNEQLAQELNRTTPERLNTLPDRAHLAAMCASDLDVLAFIDGLAVRIEGRACEMWESVSKVLYVPRKEAAQDGDAPNDLSEADERDLRDFLHWLTVVVHRLRHEFTGMLRHCGRSAGTEIFCTLIEHSLFQTATVAFLRRRFQDVFREVPYPDELTEPELATVEESAREIRRQTRRFDEILGVVDRLVAQWSRLGTEQKKWITGDLKKPREYLSTLIVALKNLYYLHRLTECSEVSTATPPTRRPATSVPGLEARHTAIFCKERQSVLVYEAHRAPSHTNLVRGVICRPEQKPVRALSVLRHHAKGLPCLSEWSLVPLRLLFHPESRIALVANQIAGNIDQLLYDWEVACLECGLNEHLGELRQRNIKLLALISICGPEEDRAKSFFILPASSVKNLFRSDELTPLTDELRKQLREYAIVMPDQETVCLSWDLERDDLEETNDDCDG